ncbi:hypothetical protein OND84_004279 [Morganella morganii]|uniref:hypothetical protein n=1 Tax=Providencia huaxiensis TaxID=2027290 RepID=UPI002ADE9DA0|nr:hypothetical protein [Morganella morganii]EMB6212808.1 hypothetical protein [Morganella morganii]
MNNPDEEPLNAVLISPDSLVKTLRTLYMKSTRALRESDRQAQKKKQLQKAVQDATMQVNELTTQSLNGQRSETFQAQQDMAAKALRKANRKLAKFFDTAEEVEDRTTLAMTNLRDYLTTNIDERNK